jgi:hemerythrin-like domain-containing protein
MAAKTSSERLGDAMGRSRRQWKLRIQAEAEAAATVMNLDQFMTALKILEDDHQLVLENLQALRNASHYLSEIGEPRTQKVAAMLRKANDYLGTRLTAHLSEDESFLFPFLEKAIPDGGTLVARLRSDHATILEKRQEFAHLLEVAAQLENDGRSKAVLFDLLAMGFKQCELLDAHAHNETQAIRQCIAARLSKNIRR